MKRNYEKMIIVVAAITSAAMMMIPLTTAYAQPQSQPQQSKACPEGFTLNRGMCQAEPTLACPEGTIDVSGLVPEAYGGDDVECVEPSMSALESECPPLTFETTEGICEVRENNDPFGNVIDTKPRIWVCQGGTILNPLDNSHCIWVVPQETTIVNKVPTCTTTSSTLNEETGLCERRPGNRA
jgi:hypothetical protein